MYFPSTALTQNILQRKTHMFDKKWHEHNLFNTMLGKNLDLSAPCSLPVSSIPTTKFSLMPCSTVMICEHNAKQQLSRNSSFCVIALIYYFSFCTVLWLNYLLRTWAIWLLEFFTVYTLLTAYWGCRIREFLGPSCSIVWQMGLNSGWISPWQDITLVLGKATKEALCQLPFR